MFNFGSLDLENMQDDEKLDFVEKENEKVRQKIETLSQALRTVVEKVFPNLLKLYPNKGVY